VIRVVLFDYGGVLTEGGTSGGLVRLVMNTMQVPYQEAVRARPLLRQLIEGVITTAQFLDALAAAYPNSPKPTRATLLKNAEVLTPSQPVYELAAELRQYGIRTAILSNMFALSAAELRKRGLYDGFDPVILSCEERTAKPDMAIYEQALRKLGVPGDEVLFVDDQERFLVPADIAGMRTLRAESPGQIVADVRSQIFSQDGVRLP
jgi:HAD superfamily hydrolase (TIGR01509 family)